MPLYTRAAKKTDPAERVHDGRTLSANGLKLLANLERSPARVLFGDAADARVHEALPLLLDQGMVQPVLVEPPAHRPIPAGVEVVSWYVMMGIGQVVTLRLPASRLREVNRILENTAWGAYRTEFYPTYDYKAVGLAAHDKAQ